MRLEVDEISNNSRELLSTDLKRVFYQRQSFVILGTLKFDVVTDFS